MPKSTTALPRTAACVLIVLLCAAAGCSDEASPSDEPTSGTQAGAGNQPTSSGAGGTRPPMSGTSAGGSSGTAAADGGRSGANANAGRGGRGGSSGVSGGAGTFVPPEDCSTDAECDDDNPCTDQQCSADGECGYTNNAATCDDGDDCTTDDACSAGVCSGVPTCAEGCEPACDAPSIAPVSAGIGTTCARKSDGVLRCWGDNEIGEAGYPPGAVIGSDVDLGGPVTQVAVGGFHGCALLEGGTVRCWGSAAYGRLGYGDTEDIGDEAGETPASAGEVDIGGQALSIDISTDHSCAALMDGTVRCWGAGGSRLGYGDNDLEDVGSAIKPAERGVVDVGGRAIQIAAGNNNTCVLLAGGDVRCWGAPGGLGTKALFAVGDNEAPGSVAPIDLGGPATQIGVGGSHSCALLEDRTVRCWGQAERGKLGYGDTEAVGDDETPSEKGPVEAGGPVIQISVGLDHTCALLEDRSVRCWGEADLGRLGYGNVNDIGDNETPGSLPEPVDVGGEVEFISAGGGHTCATLTSGALRCWGVGNALGYTGTEDIGDNETPASAGDVPWLD